MAKPHGSTVQVECYAGYRAEQEPLAVHLAGRRRLVLGIGKRWREPGFEGYWVRLDDGHRYELRYEPRQHRWTSAPLDRSDG